MRRPILAIAALLLTAGSGTALGQILPTIEIGQTASASALSGVDLYRVGGISGTEIKLTLTAPGKSGLVFYTPEGEEMLAAHGGGVVGLTVILPRNDVFVIAVIRSEKTPYSLKVAGIEPDSHFASFAALVGYRHTFQNDYTVTQCWLDLGRTIRATTSDGEVLESTIGRGGKTYHSMSKNGQSAKWETLRTIEGNDVITTLVSADGQTTSQRRSLDTLSPSPNGGFTGYLCS